MSATVSLNGLYQFPGWVVDNINLDFKLSIGEIVLRPDARRRVNKCPCCGHPMGAMRVVERQVLDLPLGTINKISISFSKGRDKFPGPFFAISRLATRVLYLAWRVSAK